MKRPLIRGLDHIPIVVNDLEVASDKFRKLGFTLKPGYIHSNGIINQHIKFLDGTELELITVKNARNSLAEEYDRYRKKGNGPVFMGLYSPEMDELAKELDLLGKPYDNNGMLISFPEQDLLRYIFFGKRTTSSTDQPGHFAHQNTSEALIRVWLSGSDFENELELFEALGCTAITKDVWVPDRITVQVVALDQAEILFLPEAFQVIPGRRLAGVTLSVSDINEAKRIISCDSGFTPVETKTDQGLSIFLTPENTEGIWIELRKKR